MPSINGSGCAGCGACIDVCPRDAIYLDEIAVIILDMCVDCGACTDVCPAGAVSE